MNTIEKNNLCYMGETAPPTHMFRPQAFATRTRDARVMIHA